MYNVYTLVHQQYIECHDFVIYQGMRVLRPTYFSVIPPIPINFPLHDVFTLKCIDVSTNDDSHGLCLNLNYSKSANSICTLLYNK